MIIKETYKPLESKIDHFEAYYQKYLQSRLKNEKEFIHTFIESLDFVSVENIISKNSSICPKKENEFIKYLDNTSSFNFILEKKLRNVFDKYDAISEEFFYPRLIVYYTNQLIITKDNREQCLKLKLTQCYYENIHNNLQKRIVSTVNHLICYLNGLKNYDIKDVLSAYIVLNKNKANNIFERAITSDLSKWNFEDLLNYWTIKYNGERFIPNIKYLENVDLVNKAVFEIVKIPYDDFVKHLLSFKYTDRIFCQHNELNNKDIRNKELFIDLLTNLFQQISKELTKKDVEIMIYSMNPDDLWRYSNDTLITTQIKINEKFLEYNRNVPNRSLPSRLLCAFLYKLKENKFINANSITDAFQEYFVPEVQLSKATFDKYVYRKSESSDNYDDYRDILDKIAPISILSVKKSRPKPSLKK